MGTFPSSFFESVRVRVTQTRVPAWKLRLLSAAVVIVGVVVVVLLLPLILFGVLLISVWVLLFAKLWVLGLRGTTEPDGEGRENVRVLARDA